MIKKTFSDLDSLLERIFYMLNGPIGEKLEGYCIAGQLNIMTESHRIYRLLEWCSNQRVSCLKNPRIARFVFEGHLNIQTVYVRGLIGSQTNEMSLKNVLLLIEKNRLIFNQLSFINSEKTGKCKERKYKRFAQLSKSHEYRDDNLISIDFIKELKEEFKKCEDFERYANTYITHKQDSRGIQSFLESYPNFSFGLNEINKAHQSLWKCFHILNILLFDLEVSPNILHVHSFTNVDLPLVDSVDAYKKKLKELEEEDNNKFKAHVFTN